MIKEECLPKKYTRSLTHTAAKPVCPNTKETNPQAGDKRKIAHDGRNHVNPKRLSCNSVEKP
jgi:hypothetical protein